MNQASSQPRVIAGRYELGEVIGAGGMAEVVRATDLDTNRPVAIKFLRSPADPGLDLTTRFELEARAASRLTHPNIVAVFDYGVDEGVPFLVMELLPGRTLAHKISVRPLTIEEVRRYGLEVLSALEASHDEGILHRDLKPANVMLTEDDVAKVADFGIAKMVQGADITDSGLALGTPSYLAPERVAGEPATSASDVYSVGVLLYELLTGQKPFNADTPLGLLRAISEDDPKPLAELRPDLDPQLIAIVERAMAKQPAKRYASAEEMRRALESWTPTHASETTGPLAAASTGGFRIRRKGGSKRRRRLAGVLLGLIAVGWPVLVLSRANRSSAPDASTNIPAPPTQAGNPVPPALEDALRRLEGVLLETGTSEELQPVVQAIRDAARAGDRAQAGVHALQLRRLAQIGQQSAPPRPDFDKVLAALRDVEVQLSSINPPSQVPPPAGQLPGPPAAPAPPTP